MDGQKFVETKGETTKELTVQDWIKSIEADKSPDKLSELDKIAHGQLGHYGTETEKIYGGERQVPLFEFRRLPGQKTDKLKEFTEAAEKGVMEYADKYRSPPAKMLRKRVVSCTGPDVPSASTTPDPTPTSAPPTTTTQPEPEPPVDTNSPDYTECTDNLGASSCPWDDNQCLVDQCKADSHCKASNIDCDSFANI